MDAGSARWAATFRTACSPYGSHGRVPSPVNPAVGESSHGIGVRARSRLSLAPVWARIRSRTSAAGTSTSVIAISSPL